MNISDLPAAENVAFVPRSGSHMWYWKLLKIHQYLGMTLCLGRRTVRRYVMLCGYAAMLMDFCLSFFWTRVICTYLSFLHFDSTLDLWFSRGNGAMFGIGLINYITQRDSPVCPKSMRGFPFLCLFVHASIQPKIFNLNFIQSTMHPKIKPIQPRVHHTLYPIQLYFRYAIPNPAYLDLFLVCILILVLSWSSWMVI